jgi:MarR family transcriptional regulator, organic hydroperoxide resistance regulator
MNSNSLTYVFSTFTTKFRDNFEKRMAAIGLHAGQVFVLFSLWQNDGQSQAELVKNLNVTPPTIYNMVVKMAALEFVEIRKDASDARIMRVFLTEKGREIKPVVENEWQKFEEQIFGILTEAEQMMCSLLMQKLISNVLPPK